MGGGPLGLLGLNDNYLDAGMWSQMQSQKEFLERTQPKGPLWFWEHTTNQYLELAATPGILFL